MPVQLRVRVRVRGRVRVGVGVIVYFMLSRSSVLLLGTIDCELASRCKLGSERVRKRVCFQCIARACDHHVSTMYVTIRVSFL